jgi:hypothetical protein
MAGRLDRAHATPAAAFRLYLDTDEVNAAMQAPARTRPDAADGPPPAPSGRL